MIKKYKITKEKIIICDRPLYRIKALRSFGNVKAGDIGGFIESENNLSYDNTCWVGDSACVYENARVFGDAYVYENAMVSEVAWIYRASQVAGNARVFGDAWIGGEVWVHGDAILFGDIDVSGDIEINSGIWNRMIRINNKDYLISATLKKMLME